MTGIILCTEAPTVTEQSGLFVVEVVSGGERMAFALSQTAISILAHRSIGAVETLVQRRHDAIVPFPDRKRRKRRGGTA